MTLYAVELKVTATYSSYLYAESQQDAEREMVDRMRDTVPAVRPLSAVDRTRLRRALDSEEFADARREEDARWVR